jgi:3-oxoacyl-[acyl-carrier-protein] synthase-1
MIEKIADNITSPLGMTTEENYRAVKAGRSELRRYEGKWGIPEPFTASLFTEEQWAALPGEGEFTRFERALIHSITESLQQTAVNPSSARVLFIISTTKGNVELLDPRTACPAGRTATEAVLLGNAATVITRHFGNPNLPIVVSNACISGLCAQIAARRSLESGLYDYVIVAGADVQSQFIVSGFQSFKALSPNACRPFDAQRCGLNLGEAAATMIYRKVETADEANSWYAVAGAIRNDANHISGPSRTGEGSYRALRAVLQNVEKEELALINVHGTSTLYNDEMEAVAIKRAGLSAVPLNTLKGYYGHTMGAAGILEAILSMRAVSDHTVLATRGYHEPGVSCPVNISNVNRSTSKRAFVKLLSGFGGCNAAMYYKKGGAE